MTELPILRDLGSVVLAAAVFLLLGTRVRAPSIIAYIAAGLVLGPATGLLAATESVDLIAETGTVLLLFLVGMELSLAKIRDVGRVALVAGLGQVVFTAAGGFGLALLLGFEAVAAAVLAVALTFSSTVVVVKLLTQKGDIDSLYGRIAVGIFLVQDVVVILALTVLSGLGGGEEATTGSLLTGLGTAFAGMTLLLGIALLSARFILPALFRWMAPSAEGLLIWSLAWCFAFAAGAAAFDLSVEMGGFLAGVSLAQLPYNRDLRRRVRPLTNFFILVFFVALGVRMDPAAALQHWQAAVVLSAFVLLGKVPIFLWIIARMGYPERPAFQASVTVAQVSEFSFIFAAAAASAGLVGAELLSLVGVVGIVTIAVSAYLILHSEALYEAVRGRRVLRWFGARRGPVREDAVGELCDHVIVVGMNALGRRIAEALVRQGETVLAIDVDAAKLEALPCPTLAGDVEHASLLHEAGYTRARLLVSALQIEDTNALLAYRGRQAGVPTSIHAFDQAVERDLEESGATHLIRSKDAGLRRLAVLVRELGLLPG